MKKKYDTGGIVLFIGLALQLFLTTPSVPPIAYSDFVHLLDEHEVDNLVISPTRITGELSSEHARAMLPASDAAAFGAARAPYPFSTVRVADDSLPAHLAAAGVCAIAARSTATGAARCSGGSRRSCCW